MLKVKLYTVISIYLLLAALLYEDLYFFGIILIFLVITFIRLVKKHIISYSLIIKQLLIIIIGLFSIMFNNIYFYLFIMMSVVLYMFLIKLHKKELFKTSRVITYRLHIRNNSLLTIAYILYGLLSYVMLYISIEEILTNSIDLLYYAFIPYIIIIIMLFSLKFDNKIDKLITNNVYQGNLSKVIKRNIIINILSIILFLI